VAPLDARFADLDLDTRVPATGRQLPTADVGYPVAQLGRQLSGGEITRPTGAGRLKADQ